MGLDSFQLKDGTTIDTSGTKKAFIEIYNQKGARLNNSDQNKHFNFSENIIYRQIGNAYLQYYITVRKVALPPVNDGDPPNPFDPDHNIGDEVGLVEIFPFYTFKQARLATTGGTDIEENEYVVTVSTIMWVSPSEDRDQVSQFDKNIENEINLTSWKKLPSNRHNVAANKREISKQLS